MIDWYTITTVVHIRKLKVLAPKTPPPLNSLVYSTSHENVLLSQMVRSAVKV